MSDLAPCPLCGGKAEILGEATPPTNATWEARCTGCATSILNMPSPEVAAHTWNTRASAFRFMTGHEAPDD